MCVDAHVCLPPRLLITSSMMLRDIWTLYDCLNEFYNLNIVDVVGIVSS